MENQTDPCRPVTPRLECTLNLHIQWKQYVFISCFILVPNSTCPPSRTYFNRLGWCMVYPPFSALWLRAGDWPSHMSSHPENVTSHMLGGWGDQAPISQGANCQVCWEYNAATVPWFHTSQARTGFWVEYLCKSSDCKATVCFKNTCWVCQLSAWMSFECMFTSPFRNMCVHIVGGSWIVLPEKTSVESYERKLKFKCSTCSCYMHNS